MLAEMLTTSDRVQLGDHVPTADQRIVIEQIDWAGFEALLAVRGDRSPPRMTYFKGAVELMSPSRYHEVIKCNFRRFLEEYFEKLGVEFFGYGSTLYKEQPDIGVEPDEAFTIGRDRDDRPDIAIEVVWTSGGIDKLDLYRALQVPEVWVWKDEKIAIYVLTASGYERRERSLLVPAIDLDLLLPFLVGPWGSEKLRAFRAALAARP